MSAGTATFPGLTGWLGELDAAGAAEHEDVLLKVNDALEAAELVEAQQ